MLIVLSFLQDFVTRAKLGVQHMVQKVGFFGILACASVSTNVYSFAFITHFTFIITVIKIKS